MMMILNKDGFIYKTVPNIIHKRNERGNWHEVQDGLKPDGIPLMKVIMFKDGRCNPALEALRSMNLLIELS